MFKLFVNKIREMDGIRLILKWVVGPTIGLIVSALVFLLIWYVISLLTNTPPPKPIEIFFPKSYSEHPK